MATGQELLPRIEALLNWEQEFKRRQEAVRQAQDVRDSAWAALRQASAELSAAAKGKGERYLQIGGRFFHISFPSDGEAQVREFAPES